ncbi:hypothetical protein NUW58_g5171 [Xylaria curta]|uniref:Uncharacterized protein n=1 Tax=Xylaria curta TaxID=42375 RepID=A0ACC1P2W6_9PEZI|nr:hypothetical protein NUW58_g5171 [Xylaria curta]
MASQAAQLKGSCRCGRNQYAIQIPSSPSNLAEVIFDSDINHSMWLIASLDPKPRLSSASPLSAFIRVPLLWYRSEVFPFFPDESRATIRRLYSHPSEHHTQRSFCGYCGTPLSYWSEQPPGEAEYIQLTLGSLLTEDLHSLQELGLIPNDAEQDEMETVPETSGELAGRPTTSIPWFDSLISGSQLVNMRTKKSVQHGRDGSRWVEIEVTEWTADDDNAGGEVEEYASESSSSTTGKRKRAETDEGSVRMRTPSTA